MFIISVIPIIFVIGVLSSWLALAKKSFFSLRDFAIWFWSIKISKKGYIYASNRGHDSIAIFKILNTISGYPNAGEFTINLRKNFTNVVRIEMISSEFPFTEFIIKKGIKESKIKPVPASAEIFLITPKLINILISLQWVGVKENKARILTKDHQISLDY